MARYKTRKQVLRFKKLLKAKQRRKLMIYLRKAG